MKNYKTLDYLSKYQESHQNRINIVIHKICVPLILFSIFGLISLLPTFLGVNWVYILSLGMLIFYFSIGIKSFSIMLLVLFFLCFFITSTTFFSSSVYMGIFLLSWVGQFIGHKIEGKKPSFIEDLKFLLIGPLWLFKFLF